MTINEEIAVSVPGRAMSLIVESDLSSRTADRDLAQKVVGALRQAIPRGSGVMLSYRVVVDRPSAMFLRDLCIALGEPLDVRTAEWESVVDGRSLLRVADRIAVELWGATAK